jgi:hypothetical protein
MPPDRPWSQLLTAGDATAPGSTKPMTQLLSAMLAAYPAPPEIALRFSVRVRCGLHYGKNPSWRAVQSGEGLAATGRQLAAVGRMTDTYNRDLRLGLGPVMQMIADNQAGVDAAFRRPLRSCCGAPAQAGWGAYLPSNAAAAPHCHFSRRHCRHPLGDDPWAEGALGAGSSGVAVLSGSPSACAAAARRSRPHSQSAGRGGVAPL